MSTIPSVKQILIQYLWGQETMPSSTELVDPKWIRENNDVFEKEIDQYEYMTVGAGRYATVDMVPLFNKFFDSKLANLPAGTYNFKSLVDILYASKPESERPTINSKFDIYQYQMDIHSADYAQRSYVHGSTKFSFNWESMSFIVNSDGSKEIKNLQISAVNDDFNYESTTAVANITNNMTEELLDRSGLGRTVKLVFTGEAPVISSLTSAEFYAQKNSNENIRETYNERIKDNFGIGNIDLSQIAMFEGVMKYILDSGITTPKDINGNDIYYVDINKSLDLKILNNILGDLVLVGNDSNNILEGQSGDNYIYGFSGVDTLKGEFGDDYLFGGSGTDTLYGGHGNDYLYANSKDDSNDTGSNALYGGVGNDYLYGGSEGDILVGNGGDDKIYGGAGNDILYAGDKENDLTSRGGESDFLYGGKGNDIIHYNKSFLFGGIGHLEGGEGFDTYKVGGTVIVNDSDGKGILYYDNKNLLGAEMRYQSDSLSPPPTLDFSKNGYDINDKSTGRLVEIARTDKYVRYIVTGDINFKYKDLTTKALDTRSKNDTDLGIKFYVTVYKDIPPPPPPFKPPHNPPTRSDPLTLDLNFDGEINTVELTQGVNFDLDGNKFAEKTSWISPEDGFVVLDLNKNNEIDNGGELFGTDTLLANGNKAIDGFQALAQYDENKDKIINEQDEVYSQLKIWKDLNQDGISQSNELYSLAELGIKSISVNNENIDVTDKNKVIHTNKATFEQEILVNGELIKNIGLAETLLFEVNTSNTVWQGEMSSETGISLDILVLPDLPGYGSVASLHTVIANDTTGILKSLVSKFATTVAAEQLALTHQILLYWTNNQNISDSATTYFQEGMSKQQFEILKVLLGKSTEWSGWPPHHSAARELEAFYQKVLKSAYSQLLSQTTKKDFIDLILFQEERIYETTIRSPVIGSNPYATIQQSSWDGKAPAPHPESIVLNAAWKHVDTIWHGDFNLAIERLTELFLQNNQLGKIEIEQFQLIVHGLDPNHDVLYKELFEQFSLKAQEITDENLRGLLLESIYVLDDNLSGTEQNDAMRSFGGNDNITALGGDDTVYGGIGNDTIYGGIGNDYLEGNQNDDRLYGDVGNDELTGGSGNDYLDGGAGNDSYVFNLGDGQDTIQSYEYNNLKIDRIIFNEGIEASSVSVKRDGNDLVIKYSEQDQITVRSYFDSNGEAAGRIDQIVFIDGTIWDVATIKAKVLAATAGNDILQGYSSADHLEGLAGNDTLYGYAGNDELTGDTGNDYLDGGAGNDSYVFNLGDGQDTIQSYEYNNLKIDRIIFNEGIEASSVSVKRDGNDLVVKYSEQDQITVRSYFDSNGEAAGRIDQIVFIDGTIWDVATIKAKVLAATAGNDILQGYSSADHLEGLAGNDTLYGYAGNDELTGDTGNDYLDGGAGNDSYVFNLGDGQDTIQSYEYNNLKIDRIIFNEGIEASSVSVKRDGNDLVVKYSEQDQITVRGYFDSNGEAAGRIDQIVFIDGTIWDVATIKAKVLAATAGNDILQGYSSADHLEGLAGNDTLYGYAGNDELTGDTGNDYLDGGAGNDSYVFNLGDGQDTINSYEYNNLKIDRIIFNEGIEASSVSVKRDGNDLVVKYSEQDQITVRGYFDSNGEAAGRIDQIVFIDGTIWDVATIKAKVLAATAGNDILQGYSSADHLEGLAGNDTLYGYAGNDELTGDTGNDYLDGGAGNDSYVFNLGDGQDTIQSYEYNNLKIDRIIFNEGIEASSVSVKRDGNDLVVKYSEQDQITVRGYFDSNGEAAGRIDQIVFIDGTIWDVATIKAKVLAATAGNDTLYGYAGNDELTGDTGNDYLDGGAGNDSYVFNLGDGQDTIQSYEYNNLKIDRIIFNEGIEASSVSVKRDGNDLVVKYSEQDQITVRGYFDSNGEAAGRIDQIVFIDDTIWDVATIKAKVLAATAGNDTLYGYAGNDELTGDTGNDYLDGGAGNDSYVFNLGDGQDTIQSYEYNNLKIDRIIFNEGIEASSVSVKRDGNDLVIKYSEQDQIIVRDHFNNDFESGGRIDQIVFIDGTIWDIATIKAKILAATAGNDILYGDSSVDHLEGLAGNDTLYGYAGNDELTGDTGNDYLDGGAGNDSYVFNLGDGQDTIQSYEYNNLKIDRIIFNEGIEASSVSVKRDGNDLVIKYSEQDQITVRGYFDSNGEAAGRIDQIVFIDGTIWDVAMIKAKVLAATAENDILQGYNSADHLEGLAGNDTLYGYAGNDVLTGDTGNDYLDGGFGNDSYIFGLNFGHDIIYNYDYEQNRQDIISFIDGLTQKDFEFYRNDNDLIIQTVDIKNSVTVRNYFEKEALGSYRIDKIKFSDNTILDINDIKKLTLLGTESADNLRAFKEGATLFGKGGDDTIYGNVGLDFLYGGIGKDILYGDENNDDLDGGDDSDVIYGGNGNDFLEGGAGNDELYGGDGSDIYIFDRGFGKDVIVDTNTIKDLNKVILNGIYTDDVVFIRGGYDFKDLILQIKGSADSLTIRSFFTNDPYSYIKGENYYENIEVVDNNFDFKYIVEQIKKGSDFNDSIYVKDEYNYYINSAGGDDVVNVINGSYTIDSGNGNDAVYTDNIINSLIYGGNGNDSIHINNGFNNFAYGGEGDDLLEGNGSGVVLSGGYGYDTYITSGGNIIDLDYAGKIVVDANQMYFKWSQSESGITKWLVNQPNENTAKLTSYTEYSSNSSLTQYQYTKFSNRLADIEYDAIKGEISLLKDNNIYFKIQNILGINEIDKIKNNMDIFISGTVSYRAETAFHYKEFIETKLSFSDFMEQGKVISKYDLSDNKVYGLTQLGKDTIYANGGDDYIYTGLGESLAYGEDGDDYIVATDINALDEVYGGIGNDTIYNYDINNLNLTNNSNFYQRDRLYGGDGNDIINVRYQNAQVYGEDGNDSLIGSGELYGGDGNDTLMAGDGGVYLDGGAGTDHLVGGSGDDTFIVDEQDTYEENDPNGGYDTIHISQNIDLSLGYLEAVTLLGNQNLSIYGNTSDNKLIGNAGNNYTDGRAGSDYMQGGLGDDYYVVDTTETIETDENGNTYIIEGDQVVEDVDGGIDTLERWQDARFIGQDENGNPVLTDSYKILENNIENLVLKGNAKTGFGNDLDNIIVGNEQDNYIDGLAGNDTYIFSRGGGTDTYSFEDNIDAVNILKIQGYSANDVSAQKYGDSVYLSFKGTNDHIWFSNYYAVDTEDTKYKMDQIIFDSGDVWGTNDIDALVNRALTNHAPTVNAAIPLITSNQGTEFSYKFANNIIVDQDSWDSLSYKITLTTKDSSGQYQSIPSWLSFDTATQTLSGTPPASVTGNLSFFYWGTDMYGYSTATSFNLKVSLPNQAPTLLNAIADQNVTDAKAFSYTVPTTTFKDPEGDTLTYSATLEDGSSLPSWLSFNPITRVLSGTSPDNTVPLNIKITVKDIANQSVSDVFKLTFIVQNQTINGTSNADTLYGASGNDTITGQAGNDILYGQAGNDTLNGSTGNDTMYGGKGDDTYIVDSTADVISESVNEGTDTVQSSVTYTLVNNVENLTLTGTIAINGTGNALNNVIVGNSAINTLNGGAGDDYLNGGTGADKLLGGTGNDSYVIDNTGDIVTENTGEGIDSVLSSITYTLGNNLEKLTLTGSTAINGTGNALNNVLVGNSAINTLTGGAGDDYLDGAAGADKLLGGLGNDTYVIDNSGDTVTENASEGIDTVLSSITYTLGSNLENLTLNGSTAINATGNTLNNTLTGNSGVNALNGGAGNDILDGQGGNDQLTGGTGADTALYQLLVQSDALGGNGTDVWSDFTMGNTASNTNADKIDIGDLLVGYSGTYSSSSLEPFIKTLVSGSNTQLYIDRDGTGTTYSSSLLLTLNNINVNLNDLINNQQIII
ncbi:calcium-binding protein [Acinetobacter lactucae]|uniref:calcium-binding protein n=1 Tax=Acinetobacter lactucae TaxID=1785128 RepID=UPI0034D32D67